MDSLIHLDELVCIAIYEADIFRSMCEELDIHPATTFLMSISDDEQRQYAVFRINGCVTDQRVRKVAVACLQVLLNGSYNRRKLQKRLAMFQNEHDRISTHLSISDQVPVGRLDMVYLIETACCKINHESSGGNGAKSIKDFLNDIGLRLNKNDADLEVVRRPMNPQAEITKSCGPLLYILDTGHNFVKINFAVNSQMDQQVDGDPETDRTRSRLAWDDTDRIDSLVANESTACRLLQALDRQQKLTMSELNGLCQSLCNIKAAATRLKQWMRLTDMYSELQIAVIDRLMSRYRRIGYPHNAIRCKSFCPYHEDCRQRQEIVFCCVSDLLKQRQNHIATMKSSGRQRKAPETIRNEMREQFDRDLNSDENKAYVYKCFVGIGKTQMYLERINSFIQDEVTVIIALPTHQLKNDVMRRLAEHVNQEVISERIVNVPDLPKVNESFEEEVKSYYRIGNSSGARKYIEDYWRANIAPKDHNELTDEECELEQYLQVTSSLHDKDQMLGKIILTTHERLFSLVHIQPDIVIIDEDITPSLLKQESVGKSELSSLKQLEELLQNDSTRKANHQTIITRLNEIINAVPNRLYTLTRLNDNSLKAAILHTVSQQRKELFQSRVVELLFNATEFVTHARVNEEDEEEANKVSFVVRRELPFQCKTFIMSATADREVYERLFQPEKVIFVEFELPIVAAAITMRHDYSFSRTWFKEKASELDDFLQYAQLLRDYELDRSQGLVRRQSKNQPLIITFKTFEDDFKRRDFDLTLHYGKVSGIDEYAGRSIVVFGTPNAHSAIYALYVNVLFPEHRLQNIPAYTGQIVNNGRYQFHFRTDKDNEKFRKIHMWMVESELVQAVGRARPITNKAPIRIYSNYPPSVFDLTYLNNQSKK